MEKLKQIAVGFVLFNSLSLAAFAGCSGSISYNGQVCSFTGQFETVCFYRCQDGTQITIQSPSSGGDIPIEDGGF